MLLFFLSIVFYKTRAKEWEKFEDKSEQKEKISKVFKSYAEKSKVGLVPFNPSKVNQDRALSVTHLWESDSYALFGVFDGHGMHGDDVSDYLATKFPKFLENTNAKTNPKEGLTQAFADITKSLKKSLSFLHKTPHTDTYKINSNTRMHIFTRKHTHTHTHTN